MWEAGIADIGCYATGCTVADGLVVRPDSNFLWNAVVDKSKALPYVCMSNCVRGYLWFPRKFLKNISNELLYLLTYSLPLLVFYHRHFYSNLQQICLIETRSKK